MFRLSIIAVVVSSFWLAGCSSTPHTGIIVTPQQYKVRRGDTLLSIAWRYQIDYKLLAQWNNISPPYVIHPGQRVLVNRPQNVAVAPQRQGRIQGTARTKPIPPKYTPPEPVVQWYWPTKGTIVKSFGKGSTKNSGIDIRGVEGQPVVAAAAGEVVYSGSALKGYGELVIIRHTETFLSAYGHNRRRYVAEGQKIKSGQTIAEMGRNNAKEPLLHFEIRKNGNPVNPMDYLPH